MSDNTKKPRTTHVQSVERAMRLMELLAKENREISLTEISKILGWPKSTAHGLLSTLREYQYVEQSAINGKYRLGVRLFELGSAVARRWDIHSVALPAMQNLNSTLGEMVQLATEDNGEVLYLEKVDSTQMIRIVSEIGTRLPMHCSGLGKVLLAYKTPGEVKWILSERGMPRMTKKTITSRQELEKQLEQVRARGYAVDDCEVMESLKCVAAPIRDREGSVRYAISVSGIANSMQGQRFEDAIRMVQQTAWDISHSMGYR